MKFLQDSSYNYKAWKCSGAFWKVFLKQAIGWCIVLATARCSAEEKLNNSDNRNRALINRVAQLAKAVNDILPVSVTNGIPSLFAEEEINKDEQKVYTQLKAILTGHFSSLHNEMDRYTSSFNGPSYHEAYSSKLTELLKILEEAHQSMHAIDEPRIDLCVERITFASNLIPAWANVFTQETYGEACMPTNTLEHRRSMLKQNEKFTEFIKSLKKTIEIYKSIFSTFLKIVRQYVLTTLISTSIEDIRLAKELIKTAATMAYTIDYMAITYTTYFMPELAISSPYSKEDEETFPVRIPMTYLCVFESCLVEIQESMRKKTGCPFFKEINMIYNNHILNHPKMCEKYFEEIETDLFQCTSSAKGGVTVEEVAKIMGGFYKDVQANISASNADEPSKNWLCFVLSNTWPTCVSSYYFLLKTAKDPSLVTPQDYQTVNAAMVEFKTKCDAEYLKSAEKDPAMQNTFKLYTCLKNIYIALKKKDLWDADAFTNLPEEKQSSWKYWIVEGHQDPVYRKKVYLVAYMLESIQELLCQVVDKHMCARLPVSEFYSYSEYLRMFFSRLSLVLLKTVGERKAGESAHIRVFPFGVYEDTKRFLRREMGDILKIPRPGHGAQNTLEEYRQECHAGVFHKHDTTRLCRKIEEVLVHASQTFSQALKLVPGYLGGYGHLESKVHHILRQACLDIARVNERIGLCTKSGLCAHGHKRKTETRFYRSIKQFLKSIVMYKNEKTLEMDSENSWEVKILSILEDMEYWIGTSTPAEIRYRQFLSKINSDVTELKKKTDSIRERAQNINSMYIYIIQEVKKHYAELSKALTSWYGISIRASGDSF
ncbi:hypothetical protein NECID01_0165 [Nematocida sp. AWRm77]|nr:hypothetical protein NECID01_0165 [Nematocida sp. AWRm77]